MKLHFKKFGAGPPIIMLHGFLGSLDNLLPIGRAMSEKHTVYLLDQRNHGQSPHSNEHNYSLLAGDLHEFVQEHKIMDPVIIGHSMGGKTAMKYASMFPDSFRKMLVVDIAPRYYPKRHIHILEGLLSIDLEMVKKREDADAMLSKHVPEIGVRLFLLKNLARKEKGFRWRANLEVLLKELDKVGEAIEGTELTNKPVYFIKGNDSDYVQGEDRQLIKKMFPSVKIIGIKGARHWVHADQPDNFIEIVKSIID